MPIESSELRSAFLPDIYNPYIIAIRQSTLNSPDQADIDAIIKDNKGPQVGIIDLTNYNSRENPNNKTSQKIIYQDDLKYHADKAWKPSKYGYHGQFTQKEPKKIHEHSNQSLRLRLISLSFLFFS